MMREQAGHGPGEERGKAQRPPVKSTERGA